MLLQALDVRRFGAVDACKGRMIRLQGCDPIDRVAMNRALGLLIKAGMFDKA